MKAFMEWLVKDDNVEFSPPPQGFADCVVLVLFLVCAIGWLFG